VPLLPRHKAQAEAFRAQAAGRGAVHALPVEEVVPLTDDAVMIVFDVPDDLRQAYRFQPGQHVVLLHEHEGEEIRRSYSICVPSGSEKLCVAIKRLDAGAFSTYATRDLRAGDTLRVMTPMGRFTPRLNPRASKHYVAIAAGSGITPVLSIAQTILAAEAGSRVTLIYGNRTRSSSMFLDQLEAQAREDGRLTMHLLLSQEDPGDPRLAGRITWDKIASLIPGAPATVDEWFMCGPDELMESICAALAENGVDDEAIHREQFTASARDEIALGELPDIDSDVTFTLNGETTQLTVNSLQEPVLISALSLRNDLPYACKDGVCGTCRAKVVSGQVVMERCSALDKREREAGYVLTCTAHPVTDVVELDFDA
jgi:ring-1,2-phenylacetyl-CoA epoxidase subunit PaaE